MLDLHPRNENIAENRRKFSMVQPEEFCLIVVSGDLWKAEKLTHASLRAQCFDQPRHLVHEAIHQNQLSFFLRIEFVGR